MANRTLIPATANSPEITINLLTSMVTDGPSLDAAREMVRDCATQVGRAQCTEAYALLDQLEADLSAER